MASKSSLFFLIASFAAISNESSLSCLLIFLIYSLISFWLSIFSMLYSLIA